MEAIERLKLRVILDTDDAERLILPSRLSSVQALIDEIKTRLKLTFDFRLQFHDPDFDHALCNLVEIEHLPSTASVKVVRLVELEWISTSTNDTIILTDSTDSTDTPEHSSQWPEVFIVPTFSYEVEHVLREGNAAYEKDGKVIRLPRDKKHNILETMGDEIYKLKAYPSSTQIGKAAEALVRKHPCLKENSDTGWEGWKNNLRHKLGNQRKKLAKAGIKDVAVNSGKRSRTNPKVAAPRANIKRPRRGEVNFLPSYPSGETKEYLETRRIEMVEEFQKTSAERDIPLIYQHMMRTFALRREEIITTSPPVSELKERWPALFNETQLYCEFHWITNQHLPHMFYAALDEYAGQLIGLYK
ncbi:uncharacterized protein LOC143527703 [Brachyhypopomus gauderio]|uniref:uncharacterized protein LOC143527703 n=1 Tax=Brachyhypopomus gauderio TaxID=698409 RepID=UPI004042A652